MRYFLRSFLKEARAVSFVFFLFISAGAIAQTPTLITDADDYSPGTTATLTGSGFSAGEVVTLLVVHTPQMPDNSDPQYYQPWVVIADADGNFITTWNIPLDGTAIGATFKATADGLTSGSHAEVFFTDSQLGNNAVAIDPAVLIFGTGTYGSASVFTYLVKVTSSNGGSADLSDVNLSLSSLPAGITGSFSTTVLHFGSSPSVQTSTLTIQTQSNTDIPSPNIFTVTATPKSGTSRSSTFNIAIIPKSVTPAITVADKFYDGSQSTPVTYSLTGILFGDNVSLS
ncbi:MAG: hypothetical protein J7497_08420, partial [Chitinophagaceae bacterium]|nr:hypothetical protein [Chitinophagaceae bacterium]